MLRLKFYRRGRSDVPRLCAGRPARHSRGDVFAQRRNARDSALECAYPSRSAICVIAARVFEEVTRDLESRPVQERFQGGLVSGQSAAQGSRTDGQPARDVACGHVPGEQARANDRAHGLSTRHSAKGIGPVFTSLLRATNRRRTA